MCTTAFDIKTHIVHTFRLSVPCYAYKSSDYFATQLQLIANNIDNQLDATVAGNMVGALYHKL